MTNLEGIKKLTRIELESINAKGVGSCIRRHQRWIKRAIELDVDEEYITGLIEDAKGCHDGTNLA